MQILTPMMKRLSSICEVCGTKIPNAVLFYPCVIIDVYSKHLFTQLDLSQLISHTICL